MAGIYFWVAMVGPLVQGRRYVFGERFAVPAMLSPNPPTTPDTLAI